MHVRYVGHSCLSIEMAGQHILTNPWWEGPAYDDLWCPHSPRVEQADPEVVSLVFITDEGEDHLHVPTLRSLSRQATILVPRMRDLSLHDFLLSLGFHNVIEMAHQRAYEAAPGIQATLYRQGEGNLLTLQGDGRTILHANSAAQSGSLPALLRTSRIIQSRHANIDVMFASRHNHSWIPDCVSFQDGTQASARQWDKRAESRFMELVAFFAPRLAMPLEEPNDRLDSQEGSLKESQDPSCTSSAEELRHRVQSSFHPGDCILDDLIIPAAQSRRREEPLLHLHHRDSVIPKLSESQLDETRYAKLLHRILRNLRERAPRLLAADEHLQCRIDLVEHPENSLFLDASRTQVSVEPCDGLRLAPISVRLRLDVLESWATHAAGYRSLTTARGARWRLNKEQLSDAWMLLDLVGRRALPPTWTEQLTLWVLHPGRAFDIWRQRRLHHCQVEHEVWERIDPYELLRDTEKEEQVSRISA